MLLQCGHCLCKCTILYVPKLFHWTWALLPNLKNNMKRQYTKQKMFSQHTYFKIWLNSKLESKCSKTLRCACNQHRRPAALPNEESQQLCLGRSYMKSPWAGVLATSPLNLSKSQIWLLWYQQRASWLPVPPFQRAKYSDCNTKGPVLW